MTISNWVFTSFQCCYVLEIWKFLLSFFVCTDRVRRIILIFFVRSWPLEAYTCHRRVKIILFVSVIDKNC